MPFQRHTIPPGFVGLATHQAPFPCQKGLYTIMLDHSMLDRRLIHACPDTLCQPYIVATHIITHVPDINTSTSSSHARLRGSVVGLVGLLQLTGYCANWFSDTDRENATTADHAAVTTGSGATDTHTTNLSVRCSAYGYQEHRRDFPSVHSHAISVLGHIHFWADPGVLVNVIFPHWKNLWAGATCSNIFTVHHHFDIP